LVTALGHAAWVKLRDASEELTVAELTKMSPIVVLAPHQDDETLGCGGLLSAASEAGLKPRVIYLSDGGASHRNSPTWVLDKLADHAVDFWLMTEDLPRPDNRITVDQNGTISLNYKTSNQKASDRLYDKLKSMLGALDCHSHLIPRSLYMKNDVGVAGVAHQSGTCRFGTDPKTSVLDTNCKAHELDNLYVVDTSFFPSIGAVNPALTAMANALRVGDHLLERLK
jgi:choline dehydrogenase-like flavoprotein